MKQSWNNRNSSDLVQTEEVAIMWVAEIGRVRHVHVNPVELHQLQAAAEVVLCGPRAVGFLDAETRPVGFHQSQEFGLSRSPHKHDVIKRGRGLAVLEDQLHSRVNMVEPRLVDLQGAVFDFVSDLPGREGLACFRFPSQSHLGRLMHNAPCKETIPLSKVDLRKSTIRPWVNRNLTENMSRRFLRFLFCFLFSVWVGVIETWNGRQISPHQLFLFTIKNIFNIKDGYVCGEHNVRIPICFWGAWNSVTRSCSTLREIKETESQYHITQEKCISVCLWGWKLCRGTCEIEDILPEWTGDHSGTARGSGLHFKCQSSQVKLF